MLRLWTNVAQTMQDPVLTMSLTRAFFRPTALHASRSLLPSQCFSTLPARLATRDPQILLEDPGKRYGFIRQNPRNTTGVTEIRGPSDSVMGKRYVQDLLETMGCHVDGLKLGDGGYVWEGGDVSAGGVGGGGEGRSEAIKSKEQ